MRAFRAGLVAVMTVALLTGLGVAVAAQDEASDPMAAAYFTGTIDDSGGTMISEGEWTGSRLEGFHAGRGFKFGPDAVESTDPRFTGELYVTWNTDAYDGDPDLYLQSAIFELTGAGGSWVGPSTDFGVDGILDIDTAILAGQGAYEGLTAYAQFSWLDEPKTVRGVIFPGEMPPQPEPTE